MPNFQNLAATSEAAGFEYYDIQDFSMTVPGQSLPKFTGVLSSYSQSVSIPKNRKNIALTSQILSSVVMNMTNLDLPGTYHWLNGRRFNNNIIGSSGGFPVFYTSELLSSADANSLILTLNIQNPSAVNAVTTPSITISGRAFLFLAPF